MNSRVSWSVDSIDPSVRERAEAAARRAGMSLNDWLNSTLGESAPSNFGASAAQRPAVPGRQVPDVADIHQRLDSITRQIEQISRPTPRGEPTVARQLNDAISRLDARLSQISAPARQAQMQEKQRQTDVVERAAAQVYRPAPPLSPASMDFAIAEIAARQNELDSPPPRQAPPRNGAAAPVQSSAQPAAQAAPAGPDFSSLERHLIKITSQIEALQRPDHIEQSIAAFRSELAEIRQAITEAVPRREIESLENEIRSLSRRIDDSRSNGSDGQTLANIESALGEIREALGSLTPAEQLTGYDEAIRNLGAKLDLILRTNDDPSTVQQLESAIAALRAIVANVASNDALARLADDVHALSAKVDQLSRFDGNSDALGQLEQRLAALTSTLESRQPTLAGEPSEYVENALRSLSERLDRIPVGNDNASAFAHLEQRVAYLLERLEASNDRSAAPTIDLGRVEEGLHDILRSLERQHASLVALADSNRNAGGAAQAMDPGIVDLVKRELSDIRFSQSESDRRTQDSLETVHSTLGHVVDRLSMIEGDLRTVRAAPSAPASPPAAAETHEEVSRPTTPLKTFPQQTKPELPNPAALQAGPQEHFVAAPREFHAAQPPAAPVAPPLPPRAISEILEPHAAAPRTAIAPDLPPDHPLEPGTRPPPRMASPSERIAASENAISEIANGPKEPVSSSSFIAAARRAAQAAAAAPPPEKAGRAAKAAPKDKGGDKAKAKADDKNPSNISSKIRSLLVGASVVVIVLGTFKMAMTLLDTGSVLQLPMMGQPSEPAAPAQSLAPAETNARPAMPATPTPPPMMISPTPVEKQSNNSSAPNTLDSARIAPPAQDPTPPAAAGDVTGTISTVPATGGKLAMIAVPPSERLPDAIGGPVLRAAALKGDPAAAYEIGLRFAEGKGVAPNLDEAAKWYDRAAQAGIVPALFRLGTFYEKGLSVKKDVDIARRYYLQAAERGSAKAMHNLAVLDADGGGKGANYKSASIWFRKAADRGVADSQFNLGILYARGIGVEQNLAESFKWFSLAAAQGDADAGRKRDDVAKRLDAQSLAAARLAIQTFTVEPQPDDAVNVASPAGGWDAAPATTKPAAKPAPAKRTAAIH
ncbi:SEL1-like repeat protein [Bradyrhizobium sp. WSM 1738]|uniref:tetratricopeptide repeat protein n=1 Tax=Bradyrhizobium hereditatis TaxID=2821405 RepID=UPI001CE2A25F|nr:tetratricopeptide repeat protein [Bradyrhizobium hereditatis]MCA6116133.1 SEL1-like repeat protein [Bradyrhizobium hereditatis]